MLAWPRKVMARMLCSSWKNVHVLHIALCMRIAASNSQGVCRVWMRVALCGRGRVWCRGCASRGGVHCRGAGGVGAHAILSGERFDPLCVNHVFTDFITAPLKNNVNHPSNSELAWSSRSVRCYARSRLRSSSDRASRETSFLTWTRVPSRSVSSSRRAPRSPRPTRRLP